MKKIIIFLLALAGCAKEDNMITYTVNCQDCMVTYSVGGGIAQRSSVKEFTYNHEAEPGDVLYLSATNNKDNGIVDCIISKGGFVLKKSSSSGAYVTATCQYTYE